MAFFTTFLVKVYMWDVIVHHSTTPIVANNQLECTRLCYRNATCSSFFFSQEDSSCHLHNRWIKNVIKSRTPTGTHYYQVTPDTCSDVGYQFIRKTAMCVKITKSKKKWVYSVANCESQGARLVKVNTIEKNSAILEILENDYPGIYFYTGGFKQQEQFKWTDQSVMNFTNWAPEEPKDGDYFLVIRWKYSKRSWYGVGGGHQHGFICEKV